MLNIFASLIVLQCWLLLVTANGAQHLSVDGLVSGGTIDFKGSSLRVFEINGTQAAEPRVSFGDTCDALNYNYLYQKYQVILPIIIDVNALKKPTNRSKRVGQLTLTGLNVQADDALTKDAKVTILARLTKPGAAQLIFLCDTFIRCQQVVDDATSNPEELRNAISLSPVGRIGSSTVNFGSIRSATPPNFICKPGRWVLFQKRVDGSLSFAQNWDTYVKGFGSPESNYWMGLDRLFAMTVTTSESSWQTRCRMRVKVEDWNDRTYWGEYKMFDVLDPSQNYRMRLDQEVAGSQLHELGQYHNGMQFTTYDRDNDMDSSNSCSQMYGFGGWWYKACHKVNLNGAYTTDASIVNHPSYCSAGTSDGKFVVMKTTKMEFKCL